MRVFVFLSLCGTVVVDSSDVLRTIDPQLDEADVDHGPRVPDRASRLSTSDRSRLAKTVGAVSEHEQHQPSVVTKEQRIEQIELGDMKVMLGVDQLDTKKIQEFMEKHPSELFPDPEVGDIWTHFFNTGLLKDLAALYSAALDRPVDHGTVPSIVDPLIKGAVDKMKLKVKEVIDAVTGGGFFKSLFSKTPPKGFESQIVRNIEYLVGAFWFLDRRPQFRLLSDDSPGSSSKLADSLILFSLMLDNVIETGLPADVVGVSYTEFTKCRVSYSSTTSRSQGMMSNILSKFSKSSGVSSYAASNPEVVISLMAIEAIAESESPRPTDRTKSVFETFQDEVKIVGDQFSERCNLDHRKAGTEFSLAILLDHFLSLKRNWQEKIKLLIPKAAH